MQFFEIFQAGYRGKVFDGIIVERQHLKPAKAGQLGAQISAIMGWVVDDMVGRIDQIYLYPLDEGVVTGTAVLEEIEQSAQNHIAELIMATLPDTTPAAVVQLFQQRGYQPRSSLPQNLPRNWQAALGETETSQGQQLFKVLRPERIRTRS